METRNNKTLLFLNTVIAITLLSGCIVVKRYGRSGMFGPDKGIESEIITTKVIQNKKLGEFELLYGAEYSKFENGANSITGNLGIRKHITLQLFIDLGGGLGILDENIHPLIRRGAHGSIEGSIGYKIKKWLIRIGVIHRSNPLMNADDNDVGQNFLFLWAEGVF